MFKKFLLLMFSIGSFVLPSLAKADGSLMPSPNYWVYETGQKGAIYFDGTTETLVLQTSFNGSAKDFAWIVPTPTQPEVSKVSDDIFSNLQKLTIKDDNNYAVPMANLNSSSGTKEDAVSVIEEKSVGIYTVKVLTASSKDALFTWLTENGFNYPESKKYILDDYIANNWYFTTAKISEVAQTEGIQSNLYSGSLTPLKLVFKNDKIVFPLKISAVTSLGQDGFNNIIMPTSSEVSASYLPPYYNSVPVNLYIISYHKKDIAGFTTEYANWIKSSDTEKLAKDDNGNAWVKSTKKMFITKLSKSMQVSEMTNDLFPDNAVNNKKVGVTPWYTKAVDWLIQYGGWILLVMIILFFALIIYCKKKNIINRWCWFLEILITAVISLGTISAISFFVYDFLFQGYQPYVNSREFLNAMSYILVVIIVGLSLPTLMITILINEKNKQKNIK